MPSGACKADSDCAANQMCSLSTTVTVCRCLDGGDACDKVSTCKNVTLPTPPVVVVQRTPCEMCQKCITDVQAFVTAARANINDTADTLAAKLEAECLANYTSKDVVLCNEIKKAITYSKDGNVAKRAGLLCSKLGSCPASLGCNLAANKFATSILLNGSLSLCSVEGVSGGSLITNISTGEHRTFPTCSGPLQPAVQ